MKKFRFKLEALEKHRKQQEQEKQLWLSKCLARLRSTEAKLFEIDQKEVQARKDFAALGGGAKEATPAKFWMLDQFIKGQKIRRIELKKELEENEREVGMAYREFLRARQQRKIMEKLHEKQLKSYKEDLRKYESRNQDEQYTTRNRLTTPSQEEEENYED